MPLKVIGAGLGRTGTNSLKVALEELGFIKCHHMIEVFAHPDQATVWADAGENKPVDWESLLAGYQATVDWPSCHFYRKLMDQYPDAKVVLSVRDPERWYESVAQTIYRARDLFPLWLAVVVPRVRRFRRMVEGLVWQGFFGGRFADKAHAIALFNQHNQSVEREVPVDRLLVFDVKQGWEPLCAFLGVPVPNHPFPHINDTASFQAGIGKMRRRVRMMGSAAIALLALVAAVFCFWIFRS